jgi:hypothetical protein
MAPLPAAGQAAARFVAEAEGVFLDPLFRVSAQFPKG